MSRRHARYAAITKARLHALEQALADRTIFQGWHVFLLHNPIFADIRERPRFMAIVEQVREDVQRQRAELTASN